VGLRASSVDGFVRRLYRIRRRNSNDCTVACHLSFKYVAQAYVTYVRWSTGHLISDKVFNIFHIRVRPFCSSISIVVFSIVSVEPPAEKLLN
jgi:hypothetical protein